MPTVTGSVKVQTNTSQAAPATAPGTTTPLSIQQALSCNFQTSGLLADQCDLKHTKTYTLANTAATLDLTALTDDYGGNVAFARVRSVFVKNKSTTDAQIVTLKPGSSNGFTNFMGANSTLILRPSSSANDGGFVITAPSTTGWVVDATHKILILDPGAVTISVDLEIMGCSA